MTNSKYSAYRPAGREHIPIYPKGFIALRIVQLVLALIILGLCAYSLTSDLSFSGGALSVFTSVATLIIMGYHIVAHFGPAVIYNYWAILALDVFGIILWIASFALLAAQIAPVMATGVVLVCGYDCEWAYLTSTGWAVAACLCAAAGLGGIEFILSIVALAMHSVMMHRHRSAGLHNRPISPHTRAEEGFPAGVPVQTEKAQPLHNIAPQPQYASSHPTVVATPSPVQGQQMYQPPSAPAPSAVAQPTPYYPQQQHTGSSLGVGQVPAPHMGSYEAQSQPVGHQQQYHPAMSPN